MSVPGCRGNLGSALRTTTYPPDFQYISPEDLQSTMWQLAANARQLERLMEEADQGVEPAPQAVIGLLLEMERASEALGPGGWPSNHPRVSRSIDRFRFDLVAARRAAQRNPPNYYRAGAITGSCNACHHGQ